MEQPGRPRHLRLWFAIAILVSAAASGGGVYAYEQYTTHLSVTGMNWELFVNNTSLGYLYETPALGCAQTGNCPTNAALSTLWTDFLIVTYGPGEFNLTIQNLTISPPFAIVGSEPSIPYLLVSGQGVASFHVAIQLPSTAGSYSPLGEVWVSR
jgi:hypothetical protein